MCNKKEVQKTIMKIDIRVIMLQVDSCFYMFFWPWQALSAAAYYKESETKMNLITMLL